MVCRDKKDELGLCFLTQTSRGCGGGCGGCVFVLGVVGFQNHKVCADFCGRYAQHDVNICWAWRELRCRSGWCTQSDFVNIFDVPQGEKLSKNDVLYLVSDNARRYRSRTKRGAGGE